MKRSKRKHDLLEPSPSSSSANKESTIDINPKIKIVQDLFVRATQDGEGGSYYPRLLVAFEKILGRNSGDDLFFWFKALSNVASTIPFQRLDELLELLLSFKWEPNSRNAEVLACYSDALVQAVAGSRNITYRVFLALAKQLRCRKRAVGDANWLVTEEIVRSIHLCIRRLISVVPSCAKALVQALEEAYPSKYEEIVDQKVFLEAVLHVSSYCEETARDLLDCVVQRLLAMDVEIVVEDMEEDTMFPLEESVVKERILAEKMKAQNMDDLMERMFAYIDSKKLDRIPVERLESPFVSLASFQQDCKAQAEFFGNLVRVFHARVLPTVQCKFVQFLMFYACAKSPYVYSQIFLNSLLAVFKTASLEQRPRAAAVVYMGSFLARLSHVPAELICSVLVTLCEWTRDFSARLGMNVAPDVEKYYLFYVVCNCLLYVLCFRHEHLNDKLRKGSKAKELQFVEQQLELVVESPLNPLLFVQQSILKEVVEVCGFDALVKKIEDKRKRNKRVMLASTAARDGISIVFPFDPYMLSGGDSRLAKIYNNWFEEEEEADEDDQEMEDDENSSVLKDEFGLEPMDEDDERVFALSWTTSAFGMHQSVSPISSSSANSPSSFIY